MTVSSEQGPKADAGALRLRLRSWAPDTLGVLVVLTVGIAVLVPALVHGSSYGPFDALSRYGLSANSRVVVHNNNTLDQIDELIPWATLAWTQVHHGHLPLWNQYSALGLPLAFNWQSATFSVPALLGYLTPVRLEYTVQVAATLGIAGTGAYLLGRLLRMSVLAAAFVGMVFELSGPMMGWLGWPVTAVMAWTGWVFAASLLVLRGKRRTASVTFLALVLAAAVYAGQLSALVVLILALVVFVAALLVLRAPWLRGEGPILRPIGDLALAALAGFALAAPLALPALQLTLRSVRLGAVKPDLPVHDLIHFAFATFDGAATSAMYAPGSGAYYPAAACYVGVIVLVLAVVGVGVRWRRREVIALGAVLVAAAATVFFPQLVSVIDRIHPLGTVEWSRSLAPMALALAVIAGLGIDALIRSSATRSVRYCAGGGFLIAGFWILYLWFEGRGGLSGSLASARTDSFFWPVIDTALGLVVVVGALVLATRDGFSSRQRSARSPRPYGLWAALALFVGEMAFLVAVGAPPLPSSPQFFEPTRQIQALQEAVGSSVVGFGTGTCANLY
ncbi:MAG: hypothetical protein ACRD6W_00360, partial [Nitrososphaerales archaeon]